MKVNTRPTICNICGGEVIYTSNKIIYGREYGSGKCYFCTNCNAYVGTHEPRPDEAYGLLADRKMRDMKKKCHALFDETWLHAKNRRKARKAAYQKLADRLGIPVEECHFGWFDMEMLENAYQIISTW